jgi:hypothetical protein
MIKILENKIEYRADNGELHRTDGPAVVHYDGRLVWYKNGEIHRLDGPAIENPFDGTVEFWINGKFYLYRDFITNKEVINHELLMNRSKKLKAILK